MRVRALALEDFRSYAALRAELAPGITAFVGANGSGKTNILEAIQLAARGDSPRASDDGEMVRWGAAFARVTVSMQRAEDERRVEVLLFAPPPRNALGAPSDRRRSRRYSLDGAGKRADDVLGELAVVVFFPEDVELLVAAPSARRRYLDATLSQVLRRHRAAARDYGRVVEQRNALLRALRDGEAADVELAYWDGELCRLAGAISAERALLIRELTPHFRAASTGFSGIDDVELAYAAQVSGEDAAAREAAYRELLREKREKEMWQATTLVGPHREDLVVSARGRHLSTFASRGEQRSAVLALKIAEAAWLRERRADTPVFLLDDVLSELDPERREALVASLPPDAQVLLTAALPAGLPASFAGRAAVVRVPDDLVRVPDDPVRASGQPPA